ncbi:MAG: DUF362 domain-containing protein [Schwartzia sp.]|nr:DUF362 domain-containing protein [Schwartzia sp. (in: firmicutes)]
MKDISRRNFFKLAGAAAMGAALSPLGGFGTSAAQAPVVGSAEVKGGKAAGSFAKVYYTKHIDAKHLIQLYDKMNESIYGKVAIKLHTGEPHGPNILPRDMVQAFQSHIPDSTIVETNTAYPGGRFTTEDHRKTLATNGWTFSKVDIMDEDGEIALPVRNYLRLPEVVMGAHLVNYDSLVVLTHFKGHTSGGFGGSLKNIAIGCASGRTGKYQVHGVAPGNLPGSEAWNTTRATKDDFMENMADSGKATCDYFGKHIVFLNVMRRMSVDCDCAGTSAAEPTIPDLGMMASADILAIDQACVDMVYAQPEKDRHDLVERIESRHGLHQLDAMRRLKMGNPQYELISID